MKTTIYCLGLFLSIYTWASDCYWDGGGTDDNWMTGDNWVSNSVPVTGDRVYLDEINGTIVVASGDSVYPTKIIGPCNNATGTVTMNIYGTLQNPSYWYMAREVGGQGILNIYGTVKTRDFILSPGEGYSGVVNIYSGEFYIYGDTDTTGTFFGSDPSIGVTAGLAVVNLAGGNLKIVKLNPMGSNVVINITHGMMLLTGNHQGLVESYAASGQIAAFGGEGVLQIDYDNINSGITTVYAFSGLSEMFSNAAAGSTVYIPDGMYTEGQFNISKSLTIQSVNGPSSTVINIGGNGIGITADNVTLDGFTVQSDGSTALLSVGKSIAGTISHVDNMMIQNCILKGSGGADGVLIYDVNNIQLLGNKISLCQNGIVVHSNALAVSVADNDMFENTVGFRVYDSEDQVLLLSNGIYWNTEYGVLNTGDMTLNAVNNFWGNDTGPYQAASNPAGTCNAVSGNVSFLPYFEGCSDDRWHICPAGDMNGDCRIDVEDMAILAANWLMCNGPECL